MNNQDPLRPSDMPEIDSLPDMPDDGTLPEDQIAPIKKRPMVNAGTLLMIGLLAAVGGSTYLMILRTGSQTDGPSAVASVADTTINTFLTGGVQNFRKKIALLADTQKVVAQFNASPSSHQVPVNDLRANPFTSTEVKEVAAAPLSKDAAEREEDDRRKAAVALAGTLKLQSIIVGIHSGCMINGKSYAEGKGSAAFTVETIRPQSVVVRIGTQTFELTMAPPRPE